MASGRSRRVHEATNSGNSTRRAGPALLTPQPQTPQHLKTGAVLDKLVDSLEQKWQLGLPRGRSQLRSPARDKTPVDKTYDKIQQLFFSKKPALDEIIQRFGEIVHGYPQEDRLKLLDDMLRQQTTPYRAARSATPVAQNGPPKAFMSTNSTSNARSRTQRHAVEIDQENAPVAPSTDSTKNFLRRPKDPDSNYITADEDGSSTEEEGVDIQTPGSPTPSRRRKQATPHLTRSNPRKRASDSSNDDGSSPKLTKIANGKPPEFKMPRPPMDMARSFQATETTSANTSFNASLNSSQQTRADTVNTSFTSYDGSNERDSKISTTNSATKGSLDNEDLRHIETRLQSQGQLLACGPSQDGTRESTSTYGSIDDSELMATAAKFEGAANRPDLSSELSLAVPPFAHSKSPQKGSSSDVATSLQAPLGVRASEWSEGTRNNLAPQAGEGSPERIDFSIRRLPYQQLFVDELPIELQNLPYHLLFISCRICEAHGISMADALQELRPASAQTDANTFWTKLEAHPRISKISLREPKQLWSAASKSYEGFSFKGKLVFNGRSSSSKPLFKLELSPVQAELSCQLQRQFGSDRFLYLTVPPLFSNSKKPDRFTHKDMPIIRENFRAWLSNTHKFLGRSWRVFHIQGVKKKGDLRRDDTADMRVVLFATEGSGIERPLLVGEMINEFMPLHENRNQNFCKALARLDLGLSSSIPTITFKPSQIRRVPDIMSDDTPVPTEFNDVKLSWTENPQGRQVMNDGCSRISVGAALEIWKLYRKATGSDDPFPSTMQGRIGGAKGMWMISGEPQTRNSTDLDVWIEISDSQLKFEPPWEDKADDRPFNKHRLTFNLVNYSHAARLKDLHSSFIPILVDRGVAKEVVAAQMTVHLDEDRETLLEMVSDPGRLHNWITKPGTITQDASNAKWQAALPLNLLEKVKLLLRSGLHPEHAPYLADALCKHLRNRQIWAEQQLRAPLGKATVMYGVADPTRALGPGEVHIQFSTPFTNPYTGTSYRNLNGLKILISRQPACRRSDVQKVRVVCLPELSHLVDVVVFPTRGNYPLAGKLQGGDYDGDLFWTCWEELLVDPFRNAPAPLAPLEPSRYGITTDRRKLCDIMNTGDLSTADDFLREGFNFRTAPSLLGKATVLLATVSYFQNRIASKEIDALCDVHDLLVDAAKQAYTFTEVNYSWLIRNKLRCDYPDKPAYKQAMEANTAKTKDKGVRKSAPKTIEHNKDNVLDYLYFDILQAHNIETITKVKNKLRKEEDDDPVLRLPYLRLREAASTQLTAELDRIVGGFHRIKDTWNSFFAPKDNPGVPFLDQYTQALDTCYAPFRALVPYSQDAWDSDIEPLVRPYLGDNIPVTWDTLRASAFYCTFPKKPALVWSMAGRELAHLKAKCTNGTIDCVPAVWGTLKSKPLTVLRARDDEEEVDGEEEFESAMEQIHG